MAALETAARLVPIVGGGEQGAEEQRKAVRIMMLAQRLADELFWIPADLAHQAAAAQNEAVLAFDLQLG